MAKVQGAKQRAHHWHTTGIVKNHYMSLSGLVDNGKGCCRNYARTDTNLAYIHGPKNQIKIKTMA